jgi:hypothetical protein
MVTLNSEYKFEVVDDAYPEGQHGKERFFVKLRRKHTRHTFFLSVFSSEVKHSHFRKGSTITLKPKRNGRWKILLISYSTR